MGTTPSESRAPEGDAFQKLAEDLRTETSAKAIVSRLDALITGIRGPLNADNPLTADKRAASFLQAGGLPALIPLLRGIATSGATSASGATSHDTSDKAAQALLALLSINSATRTELSTATNAVPPLIDAFRAAPTPEARSAAAAMLHMLAVAHPEECGAMAEAGVVELVIAFYIDVGNMSPDVWDAFVAQDFFPPGTLVRSLVCSGPRAANDLGRVISGPQALSAFTALIVLQVRNPCSRIAAPSDNIPACLEAGKPPYPSCPWHAVVS